MKKNIQIQLAGKRWIIETAQLAIAVLGILYAVGIAGLSIPLHPDFALLTPVNLLVSLAIVLLFHPDWSRNTLLFLVSCYAIGFGAEIFGVQTGLLFGNYQYGPVLGPKALDTPYLIGINWILLVYSSAVLVNQSLPGKNKWLKAAIGASIMVALDIFIEPVAIKYDFWTWQGRSNPPLHNFIGWWIVAFFVHFIFQAGQNTVKNKVGVALLILQFVFFITLNLI